MEVTAKKMLLRNRTREQNHIKFKENNNNCNPQIFYFQHANKSLPYI